MHIVSLLHRLRLVRPAHFVYSTYCDVRANCQYYLAAHCGYHPRSLGYESQDRVVIEELFKRKRGGFFVDAGAADGFSGSNTWVLENHYGWRGICIEPNERAFQRLQKTRACCCVNACLNTLAGEVEFVDDGEHSGIVADDTDNNPHLRTWLAGASSERKAARPAETLEDVLARCEAPAVIDYLSLDVEGAELRVLGSFPFDRYTFLAMTVERVSEALHGVLTQNDYVFVRNLLTDSLYLHRRLASALPGLRFQEYAPLPPKNF